MSKLVVAISGLFFGIGLAASGMAKPEVVLSFLQLQDFGLLLVLLSAALINGIVFHLLHGGYAPTGLMYGLRQYPLGRNTIVGGVLFGLGWGLSGVCPGAGYASLGMGNWPIVFALVGMMLGAVTYHWLAEKFPKNAIIHDRERS